MKWLRGFNRVGYFQLTCADCGSVMHEDQLRMLMGDPLAHHKDEIQCHACERNARAALLPERDGISPMMGAE